MPRYNAYYKVKVPAYCQFSVEAESEQEAAALLEQMLEHGSFQSVPMDTDWSGSDDDEVGISSLEYERHQFPQVEMIENFVPLTKKPMTIVEIISTTPMKSKEIPIIKITPLNNGAIRKGINYSGRPAFIMDVEYTLEDGRKIQSTESAVRKKDLPRALERAQQAADGKCFLANFNDAGEFWGTTQKWRIGGAGLVPQPEAEA